MNIRTLLPQICSYASLAAIIYLLATREPFRDTDLIMLAALVFFIFVCVIIIVIQKIKAK